MRVGVGVEVDDVKERSECAVDYKACGKRIG